MTTTIEASRLALLHSALRLEWFTVGWNLVEGTIAVTAAVGVGSTALLGFGLDSFVESTSAGVLIWRLQVERVGRLTPKDIERLDQRAHRLVGWTLFLLAAYVGGDAILTMYWNEQPGASLVGIGLTSVSLVVMLWLARAKRQTAQALGSRALEADSFQTTACWWLSLIVLVGTGLNAVFGWWWADPLAALGMTYFLVKEGRQAWRGDDCCG